MSRVHAGQKFMNVTKYDQSVTGPSKMTRIHSEHEDYHKASTLSAWFFMKYDKPYKWFRNKSSHRREELRAEYEKDTYESRFDGYLQRFGKTRKESEEMSDGIRTAWRDEFEQYEENKREERFSRHLSDDEAEREDAYALLAEIGVPFSPDGEPLGIGWDD